MAELSDLELLNELGVEAKTDKKKKLTTEKERIIAGFEEIQKFVEEHGRHPAQAEGSDIFERLYATRLKRIGKFSQCHDLVSDLDHQGLLQGSAEPVEKLPTDISDNELLAQLGIEQKKGDIITLKHVRSCTEVHVAEDIANRTGCEDFAEFKPLFEGVQDDLDKGRRETIRFRKDAGFAKTDIKQNHFIIVGGQTAFIASVGDQIKAPNGEDDARLRVIYSNGTESDILLRSLIRAMYKNETSRLISEPNAGPLFSNDVDTDSIPDGTIYVLRSKSDNPVVKENREILHKIGVTGGDVNKRVANARYDATFLLADIEIVATYKLSNINRKKMENLIHKFFSNAQLDIAIKDRFGNPVSPREWFLVPLFIIDEVVDKIRDASITDYAYDVENAELVKISK